MVKAAFYYSETLLKRNLITYAQSKVELINGNIFTHLVLLYDNEIPNPKDYEEDCYLVAVEYVTPHYENKNVAVLNNNPNVTTLNISSAGEYKGALFFFSKMNIYSTKGFCKNYKITKRGKVIETGFLHRLLQKYMYYLINK